ncbi:DNA-binding protein [Pueribacillus theae]|uniref:DNA-binding protein n=1 Tax=Pueribacillus theae TaxID=2171751 RepID=A0A2U1K3G8_9BACI|nr:excisionase family DNA-binding protein [Pueribacillus theae]PWA12080.1 DNA-binding protein [Pueribacillus theae]
MIERQTMTAKEAAQYIGVSYWLILEMAKRGEIPCIRAGKRVLFRNEALDLWMSGQEMRSMQQSVSNKEYGVLRKIEV